METVEHLFFQCSIAKCIWGMIGICLGSKCIPSSIAQYKLWIQNVLPQGKAVHHFGFSAICWATWKSRNKVVFDKKLIKHSAEIVIHACVFLLYWAGLFKPDFAGGVTEEIKVLLVIARRVLAQQKGSPRQCRCCRHLKEISWKKIRSLDGASRGCPSS
jgi:hypothetical protein